MPEHVQTTTAANGNGPGHSTFDDETPQPVEVPVLIVGGGPTGLLSAYMLSKLGGMCKPSLYQTASTDDSP